MVDDGDYKAQDSEQMVLLTRYFDDLHDYESEERQRLSNNLFKSEEEIGSTTNPEIGNKDS